jgi:hypothetical protein
MRPPLGEPALVPGEVALQLGRLRPQVVVVRPPRRAAVTSTRRGGGCLRLRRHGRRGCLGGVDEAADARQRDVTGAIWRSWFSTWKLDAVVGARHDTARAAGLPSRPGPGVTSRTRLGSPRGVRVAGAVGRKLVYVGRLVKMLYMGSCFSFGINWIFYIYFIAILQKIYGPPQILQKYTSAAVAHGVRDLTSWPTVVGGVRSGPLAWARLGAIRHGVRGLASWATASGPSAMGHGGSRPASAVGHDARNFLYLICHDFRKIIG